MKQVETIAGVILAGGKSSRMGQDKATLSWRGRSLLGHMENTLRASSLSQVYISRAGEIADEILGRGPLAGVYATLKALLGKHTHLVYVPVDMPALTLFQLERLIAAPSDWAGVCFADHVLPFRVRIDEQWIEKIEEMLKQEKGCSLRSFQRHVGMETLAIDPHIDAPCFINVNTPKEWQAFVGENP